MRLLHRSIRPVGRPIGFRFDDTPIEALEGETIAAALSAAGILAYRRTDSGAPRGLHCGMGACFDCVVTVDGRIGQRACMTKVADGMQVTGEPTLPLASLGNTPPAPAEDHACDVLVVGAGPAGLSAGVAAAEAGAYCGHTRRAQRHRRAVRQAACRQPCRFVPGRAIPPRSSSAESCPSRRRPH